jgi:NAD(P)-dependent dehydrogenase (short-subunit alcohol dehydrogenase family)
VDVSLGGKVAIVTGAGPNIGSGIALSLARYGARVACTDIKLDAAEAAVARIERNGGIGLALTGDASIESDAVTNINDTLDAFGRLDIVINNAASLHAAHILDDTLTEFNRAITIALNSNFLYTKYGAIAMIERGIRGSVIAIGSCLGQQGGAGFISYATHKGGIANFVRAAAMDLAPYGIRVNSFSPTAPQPDNPELLAQWRREGLTELRPRGPERERPSWWRSTGSYDVRAAIPMGEPSTPTDIGHTVAWLCSDYARLITGCDFTADGGVLAKHWGYLPDAASTLGPAPLIPIDATELEGPAGTSEFADLAGELTNFRARFARFWKCCGSPTKTRTQTRRSTSTDISGIRYRYTHFYGIGISAPGCSA